MPTSNSARAVLDAARSFRTSAPPIAHKLGRFTLPAAALVEASDVDVAHDDGTAIRVHFRHGAATGAVTLPRTSDGRRAIALKSGQSVSVAVQGSVAAAAEFASGYLVYHDALGLAADLIVRPTHDGFEDYFSFERRPSTPRVDYLLTLPPTVAGLRLSSNVLELVDDDGTPLVHASPPVLVDSAGRETTATLSVAGCAVDRDSQPAWHRRPLRPGSATCRVSVTWNEATVQYPAVLDPNWSMGGSMPVAVVDMNVEVLRKQSPQLVVAFGGAVGNQITNVTQFFDPDTGTWSVGPALNVARGGGPSVYFNNDFTADGDRIFVAGGYSPGTDPGTANVEASTEVLSRDASGRWSWSLSAPMQTARVDHTATLIGQQILIVGGWPSSGPAMDSVELYDTTSATFATPAPPPLPQARAGQHAIASPDSRSVLIVGGYDVNYNETLTSELFVGGQWVAAPDFPNTQYDPVAIQLPDGRAMFAGGWSYTDATQQTVAGVTAVELFTFSASPPYGTWSSAEAFTGSSSSGTVSILGNGAVLLGPLSTFGPTPGPWLPTTDVHLYDPLSGHWSDTATSSMHQDGGSATLAKSDGSSETIVFGGQSTSDGGKTWASNGITEIFTPTANGQPCSVGPECATDLCEVGTCQPQGFPITLDATALSNKGLVIVGYSSKPIDTSQPRALRLPAGTYALQVYGGLVSSAAFTVKPDGTLDYDPALEGVLTGHGTTSLKVNGKQITIETRLTQTQIALLAYHYTQGVETDQLPFTAQTPQTFVLLPVPSFGYQLDVDGANLGDLQFSLDLNGNVHIPPDHLSIARGDGTSTLLITGAHVAITIPDGFGDASLSDGIALPAGKTTDIWVLPYAGGSQFTLQIAGESAPFTVTTNGDIIGNPELLHALGMHGDNAPYCTSDTAQNVENGWDYTALTCSGVDQESVNNEIDAPTPVPTPPARLTGPGRPPLKLPRNRLPAGGDPVLGDGEFLIDRVDASLAGYGIHYEFRRSYRSGLDNDGPLGPGWDHNYDQRILGSAVFDQQDPSFDPTTAGDLIGTNCDKTVQYQDGEGNFELFTAAYWRTAGDLVEYFNGQNGDSQLEYHMSLFGTSYWRLVRADGTLLVFDRAGFLSLITDFAGNSLTFAWDRAVAPPPPRSDCAAGGYTAPDCAAWLGNLTKYPIGQRRRLASVSDASRTVYYVYAQSNPQNIYPNDRLQCISLENDCNARVLTSFGYDSSSRLSQVTRGLTAVVASESYKYHAPVSDSPYCLPSADLSDYCHRLCDSPTASPCNQDYTARTEGKCASTLCEQPGVFSCSDINPEQTFVLKNSANQYLCCTTQVGSQNAQVCEAFLWRGSTCIDGCENIYQCQQAVDSTKYAFYSGGGSQDLNNDITDVFDDKGNLVVHNDYGEDRTLVSFDHVIRQQIGSASSDNTITFDYHDLDIEAHGGHGTIYNDSNGAQAWGGLYSTPDPTGLVQQYQIPASELMVVCPRVCPNGAQTCDVTDYGPPELTTTVAETDDATKYAVVIHDLHGLTRVQYLAKDFRVMRDVTAQTNEVTDYDYKSALVRGVLAASGVRSCLERDSMGRVTQSSLLPASGYAGSKVTQATVFAYGPTGQLDDVTRDWFGAPVHTHYERDPATSRVTSIDQDVQAGLPPLHTSFSYDGEVPPAGILETPTQITYPNKRVDKFSSFDPSMGGPRSITIDATSATPEVRFAQYDTFGRVTEEGEVNRYAQRYAYTDASNVWKLTSVGHSLDGVKWVDVAVQSHVVDDETIVDSVQEATRTTSFTNVGRFPTEKDLIATVAPSGTTLPPTQTSCYNYAPDGRLDAVIQPEGNGILYTYLYSSAGRFVLAQKGFGIDTSGSWATGCRGRSAPQNDPGLGTLRAQKFLPGGFISATMDENLVERQYVTDGFGRVLSIALIPNSQRDDSATVPTQQFGYDSAGQRIWEALRTPGTAYGRPTLPDNTVLGYVEYSYDFAGRVTEQDTHVVETGEVLTKTFVYDDLAGTVAITDRGVTTVESYDGRGRLSKTTLPDQSTTTIVHGLGVDTATVQTNSKGNLVRTFNYDTRGLLLNVQTATNQLLYQASYDDDGNQLTETRPGMTQPITWAYDSFGRLVTETKTLTVTTPPSTTAATSTYQYDGNDRVTAYYDAENPVATGVPWKMTFTGSDAPLTVTDPLQRTGTYTYSSATNWPRALVQTMQEPNGRTTSFAYDSQARLLDLYYGTCATTRNPWECNGAAPLATQRHMTYDARGNLWQVDAPAPRPSVYLTYDSVGRIIDDQVGADSLVHHSYLDQGRTNQTQVSYGGLVATMTHRYDAMDHLHTVELQGQTTPLATYDFGVGVGGPLTLAYSNGATAAYSYDDKLRQTGIDVTFKAPGSTTSTFVTSLHEAFGADSIPRLRQHKIGTKAPLTDIFQVDTDGRLTAENPLVGGIASLPSGEIDNNNFTVTSNLTKGTNWRQYDLDKIGNIKQRRMSNSTLVHVVDKLSRLTKLGTTSMTIDATDNLRGLQGNSVQFTFDPFTGTVSKETSGLTQTTFTYDALDRRRVEHHSNDNSDHLYVWDGSQLVAHGTATDMTLDVPGDDIDGHIVSIDQMGSGSQWFYHQGPDQSVLAVTGSAGLVEAYTYTAFGELSIWNAAGNPITKSAFGNIFQFQGQVYDESTATYSMRARQYQPSWGQFLSPDPFSVRAADSLYAFTGSRPLHQRDPLGMLSCDLAAGHCYLDDSEHGDALALVGYQSSGLNWSDEPNGNVLLGPSGILEPGTFIVAKQIGIFTYGYAGKSEQGDDIWVRIGGEHDNFVNLTTYRIDDRSYENIPWTPSDHGGPQIKPPSGGARRSLERIAKQIGKRAAPYAKTTVTLATGLVVFLATGGAAVGTGLGGVGSALGGAFGDLLAGGSHRHHIPAADASPVSTDAGPALKMDPTEHLRLFSSGNGDLARYWRNEQARLINEELNPWGAIMVDIWDIEIRFGMKYAQGIAELLNYAATIWPPEQFPLR